MLLYVHIGLSFFCGKVSKLLYVHMGLSIFCGKVSKLLYVHIGLSIFCGKVSKLLYVHIGLSIFCGKVSKQACCFTSTEARRLIRDWESVGGGGGEKESSSFMCSDPQKPKRPSATAAILRRWGPRQSEATCVLRCLLFQELCRAESQRPCP